MILCVTHTHIHHMSHIYIPVHSNILTSYLPQNACDTKQ